MSVSLSPMTAADVPRVHAIEVAASPDPWSLQLFRAELEDARTDRHWLVARLDGQVVGFGGLLFVLDEAHIMNLAVDPARQREGVASQLVGQLLLDAGDRGATGVTLEVRASNEPACGLYQRFGFERAGRRPRYYPDGEDAVIMWLHRIYRQDLRSRLLAERGAASC